MNKNIIDVFRFKGQLLHIAQCSFTFSIVDVTVELQNLQSKEVGKLVIKPCLISLVFSIWFCISAGPFASNFFP